MSIVGLVLALVVAALHVVFFVLESFLWTKPFGLKFFRQTKEAAEATKVLALNQGYYNAGAAVLLAWAALGGHADFTIALLLFIVAMGIVGGLSAKKSILVVQALPAAIAAAAVYFT
jgi:putative membrane protein